MPVFKSGEVAPDWGEMIFFEVMTLSRGSAHQSERRAPKEKIIVCQGQGLIEMDGTEIAVAAGANLDLPGGAEGFAVSQVDEDLVAVRLCGSWGEETGGSGVFTVESSPAPADRGDPVPYPKSTNFDSHFHDCDEYWVVWAGSGLTVSEGEAYDVGPGDCIATGMGDHHDVPHVNEPLRGVYFETTLRGAKRRGHLWEHTHGPAKPSLDRLLDQ